MTEQTYTCSCGFTIFLSKGWKRQCPKCGRKYERLNDKIGTVLIK